MNDIVTLPAKLRTEIGTGPARALRKQGLIPAIIYGKNKEPISVALAEKEITKYYRKPQYISQVFEFDIDGKKLKVLPKTTELHPLTDIVRHADFVFVEDEVQNMHIPIVYTNQENCLGVKRGGYFNIVKRSLKVACPVKNLVRKLEIDTTSMPIGKTIKAKEIKLPEGAQLIDKNELVVASIIGKRGKSTDEAAEGEESAA